MPPQPTAAAKGDPPVALLVDRDEDTRALYSENLIHHGYAVDHASDGREALTKAIVDGPNIIVTDTRLAFIDGYRLIELLRSDTHTSAIPIIVVTGDAF